MASSSEAVAQAQKFHVKALPSEIFINHGINLETRLFETREHVLLKSDQKVDGRSQYVWTVFATTTDEAQGDNHLVDLLTRSDTRAGLTAKLKPYGTLLGFTNVATQPA